MIPLELKKELVDQNDTEFSIVQQCKMLDINRSSLYYKPVSVSEEDLTTMRVMDEMYLEDPTRGTRRYASDLAAEKIFIGRDKARTLMRTMGIYARWPGIIPSR